MGTEMRTKTSLGIILAAVVAIGLTAVSVNGQTSESRRAARRDRRIQALASLEAPVDPQPPYYGEPKAEGRELGAGRGNWIGGPGAGRGRGQEYNDFWGDGQGRGAGRGDWIGGPGAGRGRGQGFNDFWGGGRGRGAGRGNWMGRPGAGRGRGYGRNFAW